jgi:dienelactone hydrolase
MLGSKFGKIMKISRIRAVIAAVAITHAIDQRRAFVKRKIPVSIYVGDKDEFFPLKSVRKMVAALRDASMPVTLKVLRRRGHSYAKVARIVNPSAWDLMKTTRLESDPKFHTNE